MQTVTTQLLKAANKILLKGKDDSPQKKFFKASNGILFASDGHAMVTGKIKDIDDGFYEIVKITKEATYFEQVETIPFPDPLKIIDSIDYGIIASVVYPDMCLADVCDIINQLFDKHICINPDYLTKCFALKTFNEVLGFNVNIFINTETHMTKLTLPGYEAYIAMMKG